MKEYSKFVLILALSASILFSSQSWASNRDEDVKAMMHPILQQAVLETAKNAPNVIAEPCNNSRFSPTNDFKIFFPLKYNGSGKIVQGLWRQAVNWKGCGKERLLNVLIFMDTSKKISRVINIAPGNTHADPALQKNIPESAKQLFESIDKIRDCKSIYVDNTEFLQEAENPNKSIKRPMWEEMWTFNGCKKKIQTILTFIPDLKEVPYTIALKKD